MQLAPGNPQILRRPIGQAGNLAPDRSTFTACWTGSSLGFSPLRNAAGVDADLTI
jgi:hypothetical protein